VTRRHRCRGINTLIKCVWTSHNFESKHPKHLPPYHPHHLLMSLAPYFLNDTSSGLAALDRFFDDAFAFREPTRRQDLATFRPR
jgi:hypothetical protein